MSSLSNVFESHSRGARLGTRKVGQAMTIVLIAKELRVALTVGILVMRIYTKVIRSDSRRIALNRCSDSVRFMIIARNRWRGP